MINIIFNQQEVNLMLVKIDGDLFHVKEVKDFGLLPMIETEEGEEFYLAEDAEEAGKKAREYYEDMAENDPKELICMVGEDNLVQWGLGRQASPGSASVGSLEEWLDLWLDVPEEFFASYDGDEREVNRVGQLVDELGFTPTVAYRCN